MEELRKMSAAVAEQEAIVMGLKYAMKRTIVTTDMHLVLRVESQRLNDLLALENSMRRDFINR